MVVASVSKVITALGIARLVESGRLDLAAPVPWTELGLTPDPGWNDVTVRQLLDHTSGMPIARKTWLDLPGPCAVPLQDAVAAPPRPERGTWVYSNGNYCALGMLIEHVTGESLDAATRHLVFEPAGVDGPHLTSAGPQPGDGPYAGAISRFDRLGGAGTWMASTDDLVAILGSVTAADRVTLAWPAMITDQYGWGHTGTVTGATACAWVLDDGRTLVAAVVAGNSPATGGGVCDEVVPAVSADFGDWRGEPVRTPD
jgi:D-alanyl-D-alanine carboxypeptidase